MLASMNSETQNRNDHADCEPNTNVLPDKSHNTTADVTIMSLANEAADNPSAAFTSEECLGTYRSYRQKNAYNCFLWPRLGGDFQCDVPALSTILPSPDNSPASYENCSWNPARIAVDELDAYLKVVPKASLEEKYATLNAHDYDIQAAIGALINRKTYAKVESRSKKGPRRPQPNEWSSREKQLVETLLYEYGKEFADIQKELKTKTLAQVIAYYYAKFKYSKNYKHWKTMFVDKEENSEEDEDITYESNEAYCTACEDGGELVCCDGGCRRSWHPECVGVSAQSNKAFYCQDCRSAKHKCFACGVVGDDGVDVLPCAQKCGKFYHKNCLKDRRFATVNEEESTVICPLHHCDACGDAIPDIWRKGDPSNIFPRRCFHCPVAYHEQCLPYDVAKLLENLFICRRHTVLQGTSDKFYLGHGLKHAGHKVKIHSSDSEEVGEERSSVKTENKKRKRVSRSQPEHAEDSSHESETASERSSTDSNASGYTVRRANKGQGRVLRKIKDGEPVPEHVCVMCRRRLRKHDCTHSACLGCCISSGKVCSAHIGHYNRRLKIEGSRTNRPRGRPARARPRDSSDTSSSKHNDTSPSPEVLSGVTPKRIKLPVQRANRSRGEGELSSPEALVYVQGFESPSTAGEVFVK